MKFRERVEFRRSVFYCLVFMMIAILFVFYYVLLQLGDLNVQMRLVFLVAVLILSFVSLMIGWR